MIINANSLHIPLASGIVQTVVTSPPYYGLRDYGVTGQLGLEKTPDEYIAQMVAVFREVRRVLRDDGTIWVNIGDSYINQPSWGRDKGTSSLQGRKTSEMPYLLRDTQGRVMRKTPPNMKPKDLIGIPWMLAFALRADGWYLRSDIIWHKPNPMPESVTDRPTKSHEYVFLLSKSARYYYDAEAIKETMARPGKNPPVSGFATDGEHSAIEWAKPKNGTVSKYSFARKVQEDPPPGKQSQHREGREDIEYRDQRNARTVWTIATQPTSYAHFATYPEKLVEPCILAGCPAGGLVFDPFHGSGTTGRVSLRLGRRYVGCELNWRYLTEISPRRMTVQMGTGL